MWTQKNKGPEVLCSPNADSFNFAEVAICLGGQVALFHSLSVRRQSKIIGMECLHGKPALATTTNNGLFWYGGNKPSCQFFCPQKERDIFARPVASFQAIPAIDDTQVETPPGTILFGRTALKERDKNSVAADDPNPPTNSESGTAQVGPVNLWMHTLFSQVEVYLNNKLVTPSSTSYPYGAYMETVLNFSKDAKASHLTSALFYKDQAGEMYAAIPLADLADANKGLKGRHAHTSGSKSVAMEGRIHSGLFAIDRYILGAVPIKISKVEKSLLSRVICRQA